VRPHAAKPELAVAQISGSTLATSRPSARPRMGHDALVTLRALLGSKVTVRLPSPTRSGCLQSYLSLSLVASQASDA